MSKQERKDKTPVTRIRISIADDDSHKELVSFRTTRGNAIFAAVVLVLAIMGITYCLFAFTGLRHAIPGYPSEETRMTAVENAAKIDSLEHVMNLWAFQVENIQRIATGRDPLTIDSTGTAGTPVEIDESGRKELSESDSLLREQVRQSEQFDISSKGEKHTQIEGLHFYPPVKGMVTEGFNRMANHPYVDIAAPESTSVCAVLDGTVISAEWNDKTGYTMRIQHSNDIVSVYKHNEKLLKDTGDKVTAGTPVAIIGNTGELSTGTHLHFELWYKGEAVDPTRYISF